MSIPRRKISEISLRYQLEPELNDVYVEGFLDKEVIDVAMKGKEQTFRPSYAIEDIEIDSDILGKHRLTSGNRQRVIALAKELALIPDTRVRFLVDRDFEDWLPALPSANGLVTTKFCDVEATFFNEEFVKRILLDAARCKISDWEQFFESLKTCLIRIYCLRLEVLSRGLAAGLVDFRRCLEYSNCCLDVDISDLIDRSLTSHTTSEDRLKIAEDTEIRRISFQDVPHQLTTRGHDFISAMAWCVRSTRGVKAFQSEEALLRLIVLFASDEEHNLLEPIQ